MQFKPHNKHSEKQIERKYEKLENLLDEGETIYDFDSDADEYDLLEEGYEFFSDNEDEIEEYFKRYSPEEIIKRYNFYKKCQDL